MPLESATYISDLEVSNPPQTDFLAQSADHIRLIKSTLKATFPNVTGPVSINQATLNKIFTTDGGDLKALTMLAQSGDPQWGGVIRINANGTNPHALLDMYGSKVRTYNLSNASVIQTFDLTTGNFSVSGKLQENGSALIPQGVVVMWSGSVGSVPAGWALCNGQTVNGFVTPNLTDRFIVGAGNSYTPGMTGGVSAGSATSSTAGAHSHSGSTSVDGSHTHGGATAGHTLTIDEIPAHTHSITAVPAVGTGFGYSGSSGVTGSSVTATNSTGGSQAHSHNISSDGGHSHTVATNSTGDHTHSMTWDNRPPYMALCYIIKL